MMVVNDSLRKAGIKKINIDLMYGLQRQMYRIHFNAGGSATYVKERIWSDDQEIETCPDGSIILTLTSQSEPELKSWVNSFGGDAKILEDTSN